ncbi:hypothetical protein RQP46_010988 [Phenoliferia psychrophenolica]
MSSDGKNSVRDLDVSHVSEEERDPADADSEPAKKKRRRQKNSCLPRKTKCDKEDPCSACTKRNEGDQCTWDLPPLVGPVPHEIAAEFGALKRRLSSFLSLGRTNELPRVGKMVNAESEGRESPSPSVPVSGAFTTILLNTRVASRSVFVTRSRQESHLLECLPEKVVSDALVSEFFTEIGWVYQVLHRPTFEAECRELWDCVATGTDSRIDPAWLSIYWMVLTWSVSTLGRAKSRDVLCHYPESEVRKLPEICSKRRSELSNGLKKGQILDESHIIAPCFSRWFTTESCACIVSSIDNATVGLGQMTIDDGNLEHLWFCWAYGIGAIMVLFLNILREEQASGPRDVTGDKRDLMLGVRSFFVRGIQQGDTSSGVLQMSLQAVRIVDHLLLPRQASSAGVAHPKLPVATIFREITKQVNSPTSGGAPSIAGGSSADSPQSPHPFVTDTPTNGLAGLLSSGSDLMTSNLFGGNLSSDFFNSFDLSVPGSSLEEPFGVVASRAAMFDFQQALPSVDNWEVLFSSQGAEPEPF